MSIQIECHNIALLLIDVQPFFVEATFRTDSAGKEAIMVRLEQLLIFANWIKMPVITTFEHPIEKNGQLPDRLERVFPPNGQRFTKHYYSCIKEPTIRAAIERLPVTTFVIAGAETDVCILQSVLGLLQSGYEVILLEDCLFTTEFHPGPALRRMYSAGAIPCTFKTFAYELCASVDHTPWLSTWTGEKAPNKTPLPSTFIIPDAFPPWSPSI